MENFLTQITNYLLTQSWQIAILVVLVTAVNLVLKNRSAHLRYLLWLIVLAKCLVPPLLAIPLPILSQYKTPEPKLISNGEMPAVNVEMADTIRSKPLTLPSLPIKSPTIIERLARATARQWLGLSWIAGATIFVLIAVAKALRTNSWLRRQRRPLSAELQIGIEELFSGLEFRTFSKVWLVDGIGQPFVWGLLRGSIYLPANFVKVNSSEHRRSVLGHELSHIPQAVFWFHPFVWWANKKIRAEREKCCDEMAIARLGTKAKDYSSAIVNILISEHESTRPVPSLAIAGPVKNIEERIKTMLRPGKKFYKRPSLIATTAVLTLALLTVPTTLILSAKAQSKAANLSLHEAAADGDIEQVKLLISRGADVNEKDSGGKTPLHYASEKGHTEVAKLLISRGAYVNAMSSDRRMSPDWRKPLHYAAMGGHKQTVELLISKGADINAQSQGGRRLWFEAMRSPAAGGKEVVELLVARGAEIPALHLAAYMGDMEKLKKLLEEGVNVNTPATYDTTALHAAANGGNKDVVQFLIGKGAKVDARDTFGLPPLYYAALHNYEDITDLLLDKGIDINAKHYDYTLLYYAIFSDGDKGKDAIKLLISKGANVNVQDRGGFTPLNYSIWLDYGDIAELLINNGADVNAEDTRGLTPYYWAVMHGRKDVVELLTAKGATAVSTIHLAARAGDLEQVKAFIEEGTDINAKDKSGATPLFSAVLADDNDVAKLLIAKGADVNAKLEDGATPLHVVLSLGKKDVVKDVAALLIAKGADVNAKNRNGETPLLDAAYFGNSEIAELLIAKGADVDAKSTRRSISGITPLYTACSRGHKGVAEVLIAKGADVNIKDSNGQTPLHLACVRGHKDVVELLIPKGADTNAKDNEEQTPLSLAKEQGHDEIVKLLLKHGPKE